MLLVYVTYLLRCESYSSSVLCLLSSIAKHTHNSKEIVFGEISSVYFVCVFVGRPVMIVVEYMENGSLDSFLRVSVETIRELKYVYVCFWLQVVFSWEMNT